MTKQEISKLQIDLSKVNAIGQKYFDLFDKHIPVDISGNILIYDISNADCIVNIIRKNPNAKYFIYGNSFVNDAIKCINEWDIEFLDETFDLYNIDMKFDCIVMNPPYQKNLHLKILAEAIKHLKDDNSVCVNLSPVRWLQDITANFKNKSDFKRYETSIRKYINNIDIIYSKNAESLFNIALPFNLGVYTCLNKLSNNNYYFELPKNNAQTLTIKILNKFTDNIGNHITFSVPNNWAVVLSMMCGGSGNRTEDADGSWFDFNKKTFEQYCYHNNARLDNGYSYYENRKAVCWGNVKPRAEQNNVQFKTQIEAKNFYNICNTLFFKFIFRSIMVDVNVHPEFLPWLGDIINPRTGLKGYEGEWTDDDLVLYFNITPEEYNIIKQTMEKYK